MRGRVSPGLLAAVTPDLSTANRVEDSMIWRYAPAIIAVHALALMLSMMGSALAAPITSITDLGTESGAGLDRAQE